MAHRGIRFLVGMLPICGASMMLPAGAGAAGTADDAFAAMRVEPVVPPLPTANLVLRATNGTAIRLAHFRGEVVVIGFLLTN
jgi:hypothetical protein